MTWLAPRYKIPRSTIVDRDEFILEKCRGRRVFHVGCANWPFTAELFEKQQLLHQLMDDVCAELAGIDIAEEGVDWLKRHGVRNVFAVDAVRMNEVARELGWDPELIVAGEVLEHIDSPGPVLDSWQERMPADCELLITVPNAFSIKGLIHVLLGREKVHSEHVAYYSYRTIIQLLERADLEATEIRCYESGITMEKSSPRSFAVKVLDAILYPLLWFRPHFAAGLIVVCKASGKT